MWGIKKTTNSRLKVIEKMTTSKGKFSLSVGSKKTRFASVNIDMDLSSTPDIVADARNLPFKSEAFDLVYFTDVIEHIPKEDERKALKEIYRVLKKGGELVFSAPNNRILFTFFDPAFWATNHRHYTVEEAKRLLEDTGFKLISMFTSGGIWACIGNLYYCLVTYPLRKIFKRDFSYAPSFVESRIDKEYDHRSERNGYTIFAKVRK